MVPEVGPRFTIDELADAAGTPKRTIRYYIAQGLISPALGRGRSAYYTPSHLEELERVKLLRQRGLSIEEIRARRQERPAEPPRGETWERFRPHPALEVHLRADAPPYVRILAEGLLHDADAWLSDAAGSEEARDDSVQFERPRS